MMKTITPTLRLLFLLNMCRAFSEDQCVCKVDMFSLSASCINLEIKNLSSALVCIPHNIKSITLSYNLISDIRDDVFIDFKVLSFLRLDHNRIEYIHDRSFNGLEELKELSLSSNYLQHVDSYSKFSFKPLLNLQILHLEGNCNASATNCSYPDEALSYSVALEDLSIDGVPYVDFGEGFSKLTNLKSLSLNKYQHGYCFTPLLTESTFEVFRTTPLSVVNIGNCDIRTILPNTFKPIGNLTKLVITGNAHLCLNAIDNATLGLNHTTIHHIEFTHWCSDPALSLMLDKGMLKGLTNTSLKSLVLEYDDISYISPDCINNLPISLEYLSFKENTLRDSKFAWNLYKLDNLLTLDLSYQNHFRSAQNVTLTPQKMQQTRTVNKELSTVMNFTSDNAFRLPRHLRSFNMEYIKLKYSIPPLVFNTNDLRYLNLRGCLFLGFIGPLIGVESLEVLDLSRNVILSYIQPQAFIGMPNLRELLLDINQIGLSIMADTKCETFSKLKNLETLTLDQNEIKDLPYHIFDNLTSMRNLTIARNSLKSFDVRISSMLELRHLDLSDNEIVDMSLENRKVLDQIAADNDIYLDLTDNTMLCQCEYRDFIKWLATTRVNIIGKNDLKCLYLNDTIVQLAYIDDIVYLLHYECTFLNVVIPCVSVFIVTTMVLSFIAVYHHRRWEFWYLFHMTRSNLSPNHSLEETNAERNVDAYISYEADFQLPENVTMHSFIRDVIYRRLEQDGFIVKVREELPIGQPYSRSIFDVIKKSKRVIVFLTSDYEVDYWNTYEFHITSLEGMYTNRNILLPIIMDDSLDSIGSSDIITCIKSKIEINECLRISSNQYNSLSQDKVFQNEFMIELEQKLKQ
ncbi:Toll-like receptor 7 [Mactra antiquata]